MGLFGFGKKKREREEAEAKAENREDEAAVDTEETAAPTDVADTYEGRGESYGPWDVDDENVPDYDEYLDMGSYYLPYLAGLQLRIKANRSTQEILGATISYGASSLEIEAFAAPKTMGLWDDVRADLLEANEKASEHAGVFGTELHLPVTVKGGKTVNTRIVGVDSCVGCCAASSPARLRTMTATPTPKRSTSTSPTSSWSAATSRSPRVISSRCTRR